MKLPMAAQRIRALVIEDDPAYARLLRLHLEASSYQVQHYDRGEAGLGAFEAFDPDVVILDVMLPDMDAFEILRRIPEHSSVPTIMMTSRGEARQHVRGLEV